MRWEELPEALDAWSLKCAAPARDVQRVAAGVYTTGHVGYHYDVARGLLALHPYPDATPTDLALCKAAAARAVGPDAVLSLPLRGLDFAGEHGWVKVAYSPALRRIGELLNFFPGKYPGGIPNYPSPLTAMLTTGLVGGGLGYGTGWLAEKILPRGWGGKLKRTGAVLGALLGAAPGGMWLASNLMTGRGPLDSSVLDSPRPSPWYSDQEVSGEPMDMPPQPLGDAPRREGARALRKLGAFYEDAVRNFVKHAFDDEFGGFAPPRVPTPYDVNVNALGQTLWQAGAAPQTAGSVMGTMYAAQQLPDPRSEPGWVTAGQLGQLAANAGKDYLTGALVGAALNAVVGTPFRATTYGAGNAVLGIIKSVVPRLFG